MNSLLVCILCCVALTTATTTESCDIHCQTEQFLSTQCGDPYVGARLSRDLMPSSNLRAVYNGLVKNSWQAMSELKDVIAKASSHDFIQQKVPAERMRRDPSPSLVKPNRAGEIIHSLLLTNAQQVVELSTHQQRLLGACMKRIDVLASGVFSLTTQ